jgi:hypothetical protein
MHGRVEGGDKADVFGLGLGLIVLSTSIGNKTLYCSHPVKIEFSSSSQKSDSSPGKDLKWP